MPTYKSVNSIVVLGADPSDPVSLIVFKAHKQNTTGITELSAIPTGDTPMHLLGTNLDSEQVKFMSSPPTSTKALVGAQIFTVCNKYNANASFIQAAARDKAIATGNILLGVAMVQNAGYFLKLPKSATTKSFSATPIGNNSVWIRTKAVAPRAGYIRQYGPTTGFNIEPETLMETLYGIESEFVLQGLKKAGIYAMREASILPIPRKGDSGPNSTNVEEPATRALSAYAHKRIFQAADGIETSNYNWSDWIYFVVL